MNRAPTEAILCYCPSHLSLDMTFSRSPGATKLDSLIILSEGVEESAGFHIVSEIFHKFFLRKTVTPPVSAFLLKFTTFCH